MENSPDPEKALREFITKKIGDEGIEKMKEKNNLFKFVNAH